MKTLVAAVALVCGFAGTPAMAEQPDGPKPLFGPMVELACEPGVYSDAFGMNERGDAVGICGDWAVMWPATPDGYGPAQSLGSTVVTYDGQPVAGDTCCGWAFAINERGQIALQIGVGDWYQPAIWEHGVIRLLPLAPDSPWGITRGINDRGDVVGQTGYLPAFWRNGQFYELPTPWGNGGLAYAIDNDDEIVGYAYGPDDAWWPVLWRPTRHGKGKLAWEVSVLDASPGYARAISDSGDIVGTAGPDFYLNLVTGFPVAWTVDGGRTVLPPLAGVTLGVVNSVNERGERVGYIGVNGGSPVPQAVCWPDEHADPVWLGSTSTDGSGFGWGRAINGKGDVVGLSGDFYGDDAIARAVYVKRLHPARH